MRCWSTSMGGLVFCGPPSLHDRRRLVVGERCSEEFKAVKPLLAALRNGSRPPKPSTVDVKPGVVRFNCFECCDGGFSTQVSEHEHVVAGPSAVPARLADGPSPVAELRFNGIERPSWCQCGMAPIEAPVGDRKGA